MASKYIGVILLVIIVVFLVVFLYGFIYYVSTSSEEKTEKQYEKLLGAKRITLHKAYCTKNGAVVEFKNIGNSDIYLPKLNAPITKLKRYIRNSGFEKDLDNNSIPDFWETKLPDISVVLATDLSNSMQRCMDDTALQPPSPDSSTVLLFHMNEGLGNIVHDHSGNGNDGIGQNFDTDEWVNGKFGKALEFDGVNDYVSAGPSSSLNNAALHYTVTVWFKGAKQNQYWKGIVGKPGRNYNIWLGGANTDDPFIHHRFHTTASWNDYCPNLKGIVWDDWNFVAITNNGSTCHTYIFNRKGEFHTSRTFAPATLISDNTALQIGRNLNGANNNFFNGIIDEVAIYNRTLSPEEIENLAKGFVSNCHNDSYGSGPSDCRYEATSCPTNCTSWLDEDESRYCYVLESGYLNITYKKITEVNTSDCIEIEDATDCSSNPDYPNDEGFVEDCDRGEAWLFSCDANYPYDTGQTQLVNCSYEFNCGGSGICSTIGKVYTGNYNFGAVYINDSCGSDCDVGDSYDNCSYINRTNCSISACGGLYDIGDNIEYTIIKDSCSVTECDVGDSYSNCSWINRTNYKISACGSYYDIDTRTESITWKDSCDTSEEDIGDRYTVAECIEADSCADVPGYISCSETCSPSCGSAEICCCLESSHEDKCAQYSDYCCEEKQEKCRLYSDYCCEEKKEQCQYQSYECCNEERKCCKRNIKCCANQFYCVEESRMESGPCTPGFSNGEPDPNTNDCNTWECRLSTKKCLLCNNVAIRLAKKLDKNFVGDILKKGNKVGLISYGTTINDFVDLTNDTTPLYNSIDSYQADQGQTCISCAIQEGINLLKNEPNKRYLVLMSDGEANTMLNGTYNVEEAKKEAINLACDAYNNYSIIIYTIGFGSEAGTQTLQNISDCAHGKFYQSNNTEGLKLIYTQIAEEITAAIDKTYKKTGDYSMKISGGNNYTAISDYIEIDPSYSYTLSQHLKLNIIQGDFFIKLRTYDSSYSLLEEQNIDNFSSSFDFTKKKYNISFSFNTTYVRIVYKWFHPTKIPSGEAWVDNVFFGIPSVCTEVEDTFYRCRDIEITKKGDTILQPYFYQEKVLFMSEGRFVDVNCEEKCEYNLVAGDSIIKAEVDCTNKIN